MSSLQSIIEEAFENRNEISPSTATEEVRNAVNEAIELLDSGKERVAEQKAVGQWVVNDLSLIHI